MVVAALIMVLLAPLTMAQADAQDGETEPGPVQLPYPGPLKADTGPGEGPDQVPASSSVGAAFAEVDAQPSEDPDTTTVGGTGGGDASGGLAATGSDVEPIVAMSIGLLAVGGSALVSSRRRLSDVLG